MSEQLANLGNVLPPITPEALRKVCCAEDIIRQSFPELPVQTEHIIHGGMYARTVRLPAGSIITGALLKVPTILIVNGSVRMMAGDQWFDLDGYQIMPARAGRKQVFLMREPTEITMIFPTKAKTVEEAEAEFTDELGKLLSRRAGENDLINITGE